MKVLARCAAAVALIVGGGEAGAQPLPPVRPIGPLLAASSEPMVAVSQVRALPGGHVLVNDNTGRRVLLFDSTLAHFAVVADTTAATAHAYGAAIGGLIPWHGDSTLFADPVLLSMLVGSIPKAAGRADARGPQPERGELPHWWTVWHAGARPTGTSRLQGARGRVWKDHSGSGSGTAAATGRSRFWYGRAIRPSNAEGRHGREVRRAFLRPPHIPGGRLDHSHHGRQSIPGLMTGPCWRMEASRSCMDGSSASMSSTRKERSREQPSCRSTGSG